MTEFLKVNVIVFISIGCSYKFDYLSNSYSRVVNVLMYWKKGRISGIV